MYNLYKNNFINVYLKFIMLLLLVLLISGCSESDVQEVATEIPEDDANKIAYHYSIENPEEMWPDEGLPQSIAEYWQRYAAREVDSLLSMEVPFFQEVVSRQRYANYLQLSGNLVGLDHIEVFAVIKNSPNNYSVRHNAHLVYENGQIVPFGRNSTWVLVGSDWYHFINNPLIFPETS